MYNISKNMFKSQIHFQNIIELITSNQISIIL